MAHSGTHMLDTYIEQLDSFGNDQLRYIEAMTGGHGEHLNTLCHVTALQCSARSQSISKTARLLDLRKTCMFNFICVTVYIQQPFRMLQLTPDLHETDNEQHTL